MIFIESKVKGLTRALQLVYCAPLAFACDDSECDFPRRFSLLELTQMPADPLPRVISDSLLERVENRAVSAQADRVAVARQFCHVRSYSV